MVIGLAARKAAMVLYGVLYYDQNLERSKQLGKHKAGKGCLYITRLSDINTDVLKDMIEAAWHYKHIKDL